MPPCTIKTHPKSCSNYIDYIGRNQKKLTLVGISSAQLHHFIFILIPIELIIALYYNQPIYYFIIRHISTTLKENDHMTHFFDTTRNIYQALNDEISKELFTARLNYSATGDVGYVRDLPACYKNLNADIQAFAEKLYHSGTAHLVIFGAGANGGDLAGTFKNLPWFCFIDNYSQNTRDERTNLPIYSLETYQNQFGLNGTKYVIAVYKKSAVQSIYKQLLDSGVSAENILTISDWRNNSSQYFDVFTPNEHEAFVDCGCYDGSTAFRFAGWCAEGGMTYDKIWSFEPDPASFKKCDNTLSNLKNCELLPYGISNKHGHVSFMANGYENAKIVNAGSNTDNLQTIEVIRLDEFLKGERVTLMKMDIEGAEYDALKGAEYIIKRDRFKFCVNVKN